VKSAAVKPQRGQPWTLVYKQLCH